MFSPKLCTLFVIVALSNPPAREVLEKWDAVFGIDLAKMTEGGNVYSTDIDNAEVKGRLFIKGLDVLDNNDVFYRRIKSKIETKLSQTHGVDTNTKRIFVIMTENKVESYSYQKIWDQIRVSFKVRPNVAAMFFVCRWQSDLDGQIRYAYPLILFQNPFYPSSELEEVFPKLGKLERSDWIND